MIWFDRTLLSNMSWISRYISLHCIHVAGLYHSRLRQWGVNVQATLGAGAHRGGPCTTHLPKAWRRLCQRPRRLRTRALAVLRSSGPACHSRARCPNGGVELVIARYAVHTCMLYASENNACAGWLIGAALLAAALLRWMLPCV